METAPLLMGRGSFRGFREARTVAPGSAASGVWSGGAGGLCARGGCLHAPSETAQLFLPKPRGPSEGLLPAELCRAGLAAAPPPHRRREAGQRGCSGPFPSASLGRPASSCTCGAGLLCQGAGLLCTVNLCTSGLPEVAASLGPAGPHTCGRHTWNWPMDISQAAWQLAAVIWGTTVVAFVFSTCPN